MSLFDVKSVGIGKNGNYVTVRILNDCTDCLFTLGLTATVTVDVLIKCSFFMTFN